MIDRTNVLPLLTLIPPDDVYAEAIAQGVVGRKVWWAKTLSTYDIPTKDGGTYTVPVIQLVIAADKGLIGATGPGAYWFNYSTLGIPHTANHIREAASRAAAYFMEQGPASGPNGLYRGRG